MDSVIEIENLTKDFLLGFFKKKKVRALDGLSLKVKRGSIFGFLGPNGAGKTTTIKILMRLLFPTSGRAKILGRDVSDIKVHRFIGYSPENPYFYDYLTAFELMNYFGALFGLEQKKCSQKAEELLTAVGLDKNAWHQQLRKFSKGMLQRVSLAQALLNEPEVVILDEPMSGLDPVGRKEVRELILGLKKQGITVFMSTHILSDIEVLCDEVAILRRGKLVAVGDLDELLMGNQQNGFEVNLKNISKEQIRQEIRLECIDRPGGITVHCETQEEVEEVIRSARLLGGKLVSIQPVKLSLEDFFAKEVKEE
jgi:ABC-2 type transport system ATP-binding protein